MKKTVLFMMMACSIMLVLPNCVHVVNSSANGLTGNGTAKSDDRGKMNFSAIKTSGAVGIVISEASDASVIVSGDENLIDNVETYVNDDILYVRFNKNGGYNSKLGLKVIVPNNGRINNISASGSADVLVESLLVADKLRVSCSGSSDFKGNIKASVCELTFSGSSDFNGSVEAAKVSISCSGSSDCTISGIADICKISAIGSCDFNGYNFIVNKCNAMASGSSDIQITCDGELTANASGSSSIYYKGAAKVVNKVSTGSSDIEHK
ncbi:MAG: DUF2807 domain-containing protein [Dysgonamonadaceae bacterium]|jgi:hypothetical protein|nr:DUF2807 domain-containing protein [Dysgonamonadaceae bacterium]